MTVFRVTQALSNQTAGDYTPAFRQASTTSHSLIVDADAYLIATGINSEAVRLDGGGTWQVSIDGEVRSQRDGGLVLDSAIQGLSDITVGTTGKVLGGTNGITTLSQVTITNHGFVEAVIAGIAVDSGGQNLIVNHGSIRGGYSFHGNRTASDDTIRNDGVMTGRMMLGGGDDTVENAGLINGPESVLVDLGIGNDTLVNTGEIALPVVDAGGDDTVSNAGVIKGTVDLGIGVDVFTNVIRVKGRDISGAVTGQIRLGDGDDRLSGGKRIEDYRDDGGADTVDFANGNDVIRARTFAGIDGTDRIKGGQGIDTYDASDCGAGVYVNLGTAERRLPADSGHLEIKAGTALGREVAGTRSDRLVDFENIFTGAGNDVVYGSSKGNYISAGIGDDTITGLGGDDYLIGGGGTDRLIGGIGYELLEGGTGPDHFVFNTIKDSVTGKGRDVILDFEDGDDTIDISGIDAVNGGRDDAFVFIGMDVKFTGEAGELRTRSAGNGHVIEGDVNGDGKADFSIGVVDTVKAFIFTGDDFAL